MSLKHTIHHDALIISSRLISGATRDDPVDELERCTVIMRHIPRDVQTFTQLESAEPSRTRCSPRSDYSFPNSPHVPYLPHLLVAGRPGFRHMFRM